jgi:hypothetical protein
VEERVREVVRAEANTHSSAANQQDRAGHLCG